jgi:branched-subunit amino acid aminotransferase/4-amino-4-deoxychorismate lyase
LNGKILPLDQPVLFANEIGLLRGFGVFDFMRTYNGKILHYDDHFKRFSNSAKMLGLKVPISKTKGEAIGKELLKKNREKDISLRFVLTGGPTDNGMSYKKPNFMVLAEDLYGFPAKCYSVGAKVLTFDYQRLLPESKNCNYIHAVRLQKVLKAKQAVEILYTSQGKILECSSANFFIFKGATLITVKNDVLKGITRKIILKLARKKFKVEEREVKISELDSASEAFATATNKLVMPIVQVDNKKIGTGKIGENTKWLMEEYGKYTEKY